MWKGSVAAVALLGVAGLAGCQDQADDPGPGSERLGEPVSESRFLPLDPASDVQQTTSAATGDTLCASCAGNVDCGGANYCLRRSDGVRFCGRDCRSSPCPSGYGCVSLSATVSQCVPAGGQCGGAPPAGGPTVDAGTIAEGAGAGEVPPGPYCAPAASWGRAEAALEDQVLQLSNQRRQAGALCDDVAYAAAPPLTAAPALRCAARLHARDMGDRGYFSHTAPEGVSFSRRIELAGYVWRTVGENIAAGYTTAQAVVDGWMKSPGHCRNLMNPAFTQIGVGRYGAYWTQSFGSPL